MIDLGKKYIKLKQKSGSHSPSIQTILEEIPQIKIKVDTQNNIPVNMRTGIRSQPGMQSNSLLPINNPFALTVGGKKNTRKHKKNVKQKTRKHKKNSTYKKK